MKTLLLKDKSYEVEINSPDIRLLDVFSEVSIDLIYNGGYLDLIDEAETHFYKLDYNTYILSAFREDYIEDNIVDFCERYINEFVAI